MGRPRLRVFPIDEEGPAGSPSGPTLAIRLADLFPLLAASARGDEAWLRGLEAAELRVSRDLAEVVRAFARCRPAAQRIG